MTPTRALYVEWVDSCGSAGWQGDAAIKEAEQPFLCATAGFFVSENKEVLVLALNRAVTHNSAKPYGELMTIPKVAIRKRRDLK